MAASSVARVGNNLPNRNFISEVWSLLINAKYYAKTCLMEIANTNWQSEIKEKGSQVHIRIRPTVQTFDYAVDETVQYQDVTDDKITLTIDQALGWAVSIPDIDKVQSDINIASQLQMDAAEQMRISTERKVFGTIYADAGNAIASTAVTATNFIDWVTQAAQTMDENFIPVEDRWIIVPPWLYWRGMNSDLKAAFLTGDAQSTIRNRKTEIGGVAGFTVYSSNLLSNNGTTWQCMAGHKSGLTFAAQLQKTETGRMPNKFGDFIRGLTVFGYKVNLPSALISMPATKS